MDCTACGAHNEGFGLFCRGCGAPLGDGQSEGNLIGRQVLGTYRLEELLGKGGMSIVYLARHMLTDQEVAVKVLPPELAQQQEIKVRFIEEARTLARLEHPNIVILHNFVEEEGYFYLVMQYAEGETFDNIIEREGRVGLADSVDITIQTLRALEYAHDNGVIHRDIKPSNIIVRADGTVKVMDFGLAKIMGSTKLTQTGLTMGTVRYMSPEQVRGKQVDQRTDLYSLGVMLYEAVTGQTPFDGDTHFEIMEHHLRTAPPPPSRLVALPDELERVLTRALKKRVENRFQTAREFRKQLQQVPLSEAPRRRPLSVSMPPVDSGPAPIADSDVRPASGRRRLPLVAAAVLTVLSGIAIFFAMRSEPSETPLLPLGQGASDAARGSPRLPWPTPHKVARGLKLAVDQTFGPPDELRIMSPQKLDTAALRQIYRKARAAYRSFLQQEGIGLDVKVGPLNLVIVRQALLNSAQLWPDVKPHTDYPTRYQAPSATLYVHSGPAAAKTDLPYGLALHFCARIAQLSNARCLELAEGFERYFRNAT